MVPPKNATTQPGDDSFSPIFELFSNSPPAARQTPLKTPPNRSETGSTLKPCPEACTTISQPISGRCTHLSNQHLPLAGRHSCRRATLGASHRHLFFSLPVPLFRSAFPRPAPGPACIFISVPTDCSPASPLKRISHKPQTALGLGLPQRWRGALLLAQRGPLPPSPGLLLA